MSEAFPDIGAVVRDARFAAVDLALRRGTHFHKDRVDEYEFLTDAQPLLESFYAAYGCELVHRSDGYFFLFPVGEQLGKRQMSVAEMVVGQGLALCYLDPATLQARGVISRDELLSTLAQVMGTDLLMHTFNPKKKRMDERVAQRNVRQKVAEGVRRLSALGFVDVLEGDRLKLRPCLMRFAEPVAAAQDPVAAMRGLVARGEVLGEDDSSEGGDGRAESGEERERTSEPSGEEAGVEVEQEVEGPSAAAEAAEFDEAGSDAEREGEAGALAFEGEVGEALPGEQPPAPEPIGEAAPEEVAPGRPPPCPDPPGER